MINITKPTLSENVLLTLTKYEDTWTPSQKDEPLLAILNSDLLFSLSKSEKALLLKYFYITRHNKTEEVTYKSLSIDNFDVNYHTFRRLINKTNSFIKDKENKMIKLNPNMVSPRVPSRRINGEIIQNSNLEVHPYTGAILNSEFYIHYNTLDFITELNKNQSKVLKHILQNLDSDTNSFKFNLNKLSKQLKVRVKNIKDVVEYLVEDNNLIFISDTMVTKMMPSKDYHIMLNPTQYIKHLSKYVAFRYCYTLFNRIISKDYPVNYGTFEVFIEDSVASIKQLKKTINKNIKINDKLLKDVSKDITLINDIELHETDFIKIRDDLITENEIK